MVPEYKCRQSNTVDLFVALVKCLEVKKSCMRLRYNMYQDTCGAGMSLHQLGMLSVHELSTIAISNPKVSK